MRVRICQHASVVQFIGRFQSRKTSYIYAPINQAGLLFVIEALGLSKWIVGACYLSACGKYLQLSMYGASRLEPQLT